MSRSSKRGQTITFHFLAFFDINSFASRFSAKYNLLFRLFQLPVCNRWAISRIVEVVSRISRPSGFVRVNLLRQKHAKCRPWFRRRNPVGYNGLQVSASSPAPPLAQGNRANCTDSSGGVVHLARLVWIKKLAQCGEEHRPTVGEVRQTRSNQSESSRIKLKRGWER
jgi:hypothetical protein